MLARDVALMTRACRKICLALAMMLALAAESPRAQMSIGPQGPEQGANRRQLWLIPAQNRITLMRTMLFRPPGDGPFPLALINHGSSQNAMRRATEPHPEYPALTEWLLARGYAVAVPQRPGHGETSGPYYESQGNCADANYRHPAEAAAGEIAGVVDFLARQPFVTRTGGVAIGQSAGGWAMLALATRHLSQVQGVIAFAPGMGGRINDVRGQNCAPGRLIEAARGFGERARLPSLWLYAQNDSYFGPALSKRLFDAYRLAGGPAEYHLLPPVEPDGHNLIQAPGITWGQTVENFLMRTRRR
jgi:dienelactone hydrolase